MPTDERLKKLARVASQRQQDLTVVLEDVFDPHNLGAISRSCDAFGIQEIHVIFGEQPAFDPKAAGKNSSTATNKWLAYHIHHDGRAALERLKADGWQLVATALDAEAESIYEAELGEGRIALLFGNEKTGLSAAALEMADRSLSVPMRGIAQSLNVSVCAALCLYEVTRQRLALESDRLRSSPDEAARTLDYFLEMHEQLGRRNKTMRKERARRRSQF